MGAHFREFHTSLIFTFLVCVILLFSMFVGDTRAEDWVEYDDFWNLVEETRQGVAAADERNDDDIQAALKEWAMRWEAVDTVHMPNGGFLPVDTGYITALLQEEDPDLERIRNFLTWLKKRHLSNLQPLPEWQGVDALDEILSAPEFDWEPEEEIQQPQESFLDRLISRLAGLSITIGPGIQVFLAALVLAMILIGVFRGTIANITADVELVAEDEKGEFLTPAGALSRATNLAQGGDYRTAVRYMYLSSLLQLEHAGLLRFDHTKTNREYLQSLSARPVTAAKLGKVVGVYERVWYGFEVIDEQTYQDYSHVVSELAEGES